MTTENQKPANNGNASEVPPDSELFTAPVGGGTENAGELSEREAFAGDENFYKTLTGSSQPAVDQPPNSPAVAETVVAPAQPAPAAVGQKRFSILQKIIIISIAVIAVMLLFGLFQLLLPQPDTCQMPKLVIQTRSAASSDEQAQQPILPEQKKQQLISLKEADALYLKNDYNNACAAYVQLRQALPAGAKTELLKDFFALKIALCMKELGNTEQAEELLKAVLDSRSPFVRLLANYNVALLEVEKNQYLRAQSRAYQALALVDAVDCSRDWALSLQRNCQFLIAESMTKNVLLLCDADRGLPDILWARPAALPDTVAGANMDEEQLRSFLDSGAECLLKGLLGPIVQKLDHQQGSLTRWMVVCNGASVEELLARFAINVGFDVSWGSGGTSVAENIRDTVRRRPVILYMPAAASQQFVDTAAGCAGLLAYMDEHTGKQTINIYNPADYSALSEHISLLSRQAISLWRAFSLMFPEDRCVPNAHFAIAVLQAQQGKVTESIAEYKLVANRFSQATLAPFALLQSSRLKTDLCDYAGAREDLQQLVEQYPNTDISGKACLYLADTTFKAKLYDEAERLYRKVYALGFSHESQTAAALGTGRCFYEKKDYENTAKWLTRYIGLVSDRTDEDLYSAYILLGKVFLALGKHQQAVEAFQCSLKGQLSKEQSVEAISALAETEMKRGNLVEALNVLENVNYWQLSQKESTAVLLLKSRILRAMGLIDNAVAELSDKTEYITDSQLRAGVSLELTRCYVAKGDLESARRGLTESLVTVAAGSLAQEIALDLAEVCLKLNQNSQAVSVCRQLLDMKPEPQIKRKAANLLAEAYKRQKNYDKAAEVLTGRWNGTEKTPFKISAAVR